MDGRTSDILGVQEALKFGLLSCALFDAVNVVMERELLLSSELEYGSIWQSPRAANGPVGVGLFVEMPRLELPKPNSLQRHLVASVGVIEERNLNMVPMAGTCRPAEEWAEEVLDFMFGWVLGISSGLVPEVGAVKPAPDLVEEAGGGLVAYRAAVSLRRERRPRERCGMPVLTVDGGMWSLSGEAGTELYFTVDGSLPAKANPAAVRYEQPVMVEAGQVVWFAAWDGERLPSHVGVRVLAGSQ